MLYLQFVEGLLEKCFVEVLESHHKQLLHQESVDVLYRLAELTNEGVLLWVWG